MTFPRGRFNRAVSHWRRREEEWRQLGYPPCDPRGPLPLVRRLAISEERVKQLASRTYSSWGGIREALQELGKLIGQQIPALELTYESKGQPQAYDIVAPLIAKLDNLFLLALSRSNRDKPCIHSFVECKLSPVIQETIEILDHMKFLSADNEAG